MAERKYTVNCKPISGGIVAAVTDIKAMGYHAYYANGIIAVEISAQDEAQAKQIAEGLGMQVLYAFE